MALIRPDPTDSSQTVQLSSHFDSNAAMTSQMYGSVSHHVFISETGPLHTSETGSEKNANTRPSQNLKLFELREDQITLRKKPNEETGF